MRYYKHLYLTEGLEKKKEKIIRKLEAGKLQPGDHTGSQREKPTRDLSDDSV